MPEIAVRVAPSPGTVQPGNLYVDLQTVTLWLGVNTSVDPDGAKLVSDIDGTLTLIAEVLQDANAYTNQEVALKANIASPTLTGVPRAPTPVSTSNDTTIPTTAFVKTAVGAAAGTQWVAGMMMEWGGLASDIGTGALASWALCNGSAISRTVYAELFAKLGTMHGVGDGSTTFNLPDLRERFVMGAGSRNPGLKNPTDATAITDVQGTHNHTVNGTVLAVTEIPPHTHGPGTLSGPLSGGATSASGTHTHTQNGLSTTVTPSTNNAGSAQGAGSVATGAGGDHTHTVTGTATITAGATGNPTVTGGNAHAHTLISNGAHAHSLLTTDLREAVPFYTLCYMIRLKAA